MQSSINQWRPHHTNVDFSPNFSNWVEESLYIGLPYPVHKPFENVPDDPIRRSFENSEAYVDHLLNAAKEYNTVKETIAKQNFTGTHALLTKKLLSFSNVEPCDLTHSYKSRSLNPLYTTGMLQHIRFDNKDSLIRADYENNIRICSTDNLKKSLKINVCENPRSRIFGININHSIDGEISLLLRTQNEMELFQINDEDVESIWQKRVEGTLLDSKLFQNQLGVIWDSEFCLFDMDTTKELYSIEFETKPATRFDFMNNRNIVLQCPDYLKIIDWRVSNESQLIQPKLEACDHFCAFIIHQDYIYSATRHRLIRTDLRNTKNSEFCAHLMKHSPSYMDLIEGNHCDYLCVSAQLHDEKVMFTGNPINSLPMHVPNIIETLHKCQLRRDVLLKDMNLKKRLQNSISGIKLLREGNDVYLYSANGYGELFRQKMSRMKNGDEEDQPIDALCEWIHKIRSPLQKLHLTHIVNMSYSHRMLHKKQIHTKAPTKPKTDSFIKQYKVKYSTKELGAIGGNFGAIWDDEDAESEREKADFGPEIAPLDKVTSWMASNKFY